MKKLIRFLAILFLLITVNLLSQTQVIIRVLNSSGVAVTGLTGTNIKFKLYPYSGSYVAGLTVTEVGTQGNYTITGFSAQAYTLTKLYINDVEQTWWGAQFTGSPYIWSGNQSANSFKLTNLLRPTSSADATTKNYVDSIFALCPSLAADNTWTGTNYMPYLHIGDGIGTGIVLNSSATVTGGSYATMPHFYISDTSVTPAYNDAIWKGYADAHYLTGVSTGSYTTLGDYKLRRTSTNKQLFDITSSLLWSTSSGLSWNTVQRYAQFDSLTIAHVDTTDASDNVLEKLITIERQNGDYKGADSTDWYVHYRRLTNGSVIAEEQFKLINTCDVMYDADSSSVSLDGSLKTFAEITVPIGYWDIRVEFEYEFNNGASTFDYYDSIYTKLVYQPTTVVATKTVKFGQKASTTGGMQGDAVISAQIKATSLKWIRFQALCSLDADNLNRRIKKYKIIFTRIY